MRITKQAVSGLIVESRHGTRAAIDFGRDVPGHIVESCEVDALVCSHSHPDHLHVPHAERLGVPTFAAAEAAQAFEAAGLVGESLQAGSKFSISGMDFEAFTVDHGHISAPIVNLGFHVVVDGRSLWYTGDIALDTLPRPEGPFDVVLLPVGGRKVFDARRAIDYLVALDHRGLAVPLHFDTGPAQLVEFVELSRGHQFEVAVIGHNQSFELES